MTSSVRVPFAPPSIGEREIEEVVATLRSGWLAAGPRVATFEQKFRERIGAKHAIATSSCTGALHIGMSMLDVRGGEVVVPAMTFGATALAAVHAGAKPVLADIDASTLNIDPADVAARITPATRAIVAMHYGGLCCDIDRLQDLANQHGVHLVEDAAHAVGTYRAGRHAGTIGKIGAFSFYANKNMTTIEGGMLVTDDDELAQRARPLRLQGITRDAWRREGTWSFRYDIVEAGFKYPMSDIQAAVGIHQLDRLTAWQERRARTATRYRKLLEEVPGVEPLARARSGDTHGEHLFVVRIDPKLASRDAVGLRMRELGVETTVHFVPLHLHSYFQKTWGYRQGEFPRAEAALNEILSLPQHGSMTDAEVDVVVDALRDAIRAGS